MTFEQWYDALGGGYSSYKDLLHGCWEAAQKAERIRITKLLDGVDGTQTNSDNGWWETSGGANFGATLLSDIAKRELT
jgi:hypothetical protein